MDHTAHELLWRPPADVWDTSRMGRFAATHQPGAAGDYAALWQWSVDDLPGFWRAVWEFFALESSTPLGEVLADPSMPAPRLSGGANERLSGGANERSSGGANESMWFDGARLNYAAHMLRGNGLGDDDVAVVAESQTRAPTTWTLGELREQVRRAAAGLRRLGVGEGDRVVAYLPNIPETMVGFLAAASLGAVWSSCAPEFGTRSVVDRWSQIEPTVLLTIDGYRYGAKDVDRATEVAEIRDALPSIRHTVLLGYLAADAAWDDCVGWDELVDDTDAPLEFVEVAFDHPLYVLYSSGTTGLPKPIVHGHGGILVEHVKSMGLHLDLGPGDRFFWFSTTGWMMWNYLVSGLLVGSAVVLFDGNPGHPDLDALWDLVERTGTTYMGVSAPFLMSCRKAGLVPADDHDLSALRAMGSTGAPLPPDGFRWVYEAVGDHLQLGSVSGGTDVCTAFVGSAPVLPVHAGVIPCRMLGCRVEAYDPEGNAVIGTQGELVITAPLPSMPIGFWGDEDGSRYRDAYFDTYPGVWRHGDWITIHEDGSCVITGRSDATLNRGGVRLGTSEFYAVVEALEGVADSLVVHLEDDSGGMGELVLFVAPPEGEAPPAARELDDDLRGRIAAALRADLSPRHVPDTMVAMPAVPRTLSGKKLEVPVKRILAGADVDDAASTGALSDPHALEPYVAWARSRA